MAELKPCPFCGGEAELLENVHYCTIRVQCKKCRIKTRVMPSNLGKNYAASKWNGRTYPDLDDVLSDKKLEQLSNLIKEAKESWENVR